jgi:hypothetical protein
MRTVIDRTRAVAERGEHLRPAEAAADHRAVGRGKTADEQVEPRDTKWT